MGLSVESEVVKNQPIQISDIAVVISDKLDEQLMAFGVWFERV